MFEIGVTLTSYHALDTAMEGGIRDRKGRALITLEQHQADPDTYPYVSVAGDYTVWPDGQRIMLPDIDPNAVFRIVDTGGHFFGSGKVVRYAGHEPLDICTNVGTTIGPRPTTAIVVEGDSFTGGPITLPDYLTRSDVDPLSVAINTVNPSTSSGRNTILVTLAAAAFLYIVAS